MRALAVLACCGICAWGWAPFDPILALLDRSIELQREGQLAEAETALQAALKEAEHTADPENIGLALSYLGTLYNIQGRADEARASLARAIRVWISNGDGPNPRLIRTARDLMSIFRESGDAASATKFWNKVLEPMLSRVNSDTVELAGLLEQQGMFYIIERQNSKAEPLLRRAIEIRDRQGMPDSEELAIALTNRAAMRILLHRPDGALTDLTRALAILERTSVAADLSTAKVLANMGVAYFESHRVAEADVQFSRALRILEQFPESTIGAEILRSYAAVLRMSGRKREARQMELRANAILQKFAAGRGQRIDASELALSPKK